MENGGHEKYIRECYKLAVSAGKKGFDTFGALIVLNGEILETAENTSDYKNGVFGHAKYNLVRKCAEKYNDGVLKDCTFYTSCAPCARCLAAIASLGIENIVYGVSYRAFSKLIPDDYVFVDYEGLYAKTGLKIKLTGPVSEDEGMRVFEYWGGEYRPLEEIIAEMAKIKKNRRAQQLRI